MWSLCTLLDNLVPLKTRRVLSIVLGALEASFGSVAYGLNSLYPIFQENGIYGDVCANSTGGCSDQLLIYANAYTTLSVVPIVLGSVLGILIDKAGLRIMNLLSTLMNFIGLLLFVFLSSSNAVIIFIGSTLSSVGGNGMIIATISVSRLFTKTSAMVTTLFQGVYDSSSAVFALIYLTHEANFSFKSSFLILAIACLVAGLLNSLFVMTYRIEDMMKFKGIINNTLTIESNLTVSEDEELEKVEKEVKDIPIDMKIDAVLTKVFPTPRKALISLPFVVLILFGSLSVLRYNYFLAELTIVSDYHFGNPSLTARFNTVVTFASACGLPIAFLCGVFVDKLRSKYTPDIESLLNQEESKERNEAILWYNALPAAISMFICSVFELILSCLIFIPYEAAYYVNFVFFILMRGFLFTTDMILILYLFPAAYFGTVYGVLATIAGVFSCLQYAILKLPPTNADICALVVAALTFIPPFVILTMALKARRKIRSDVEDNEKHPIDSNLSDEFNNTF